MASNRILIASSAFVFSCLTGQAQTNSITFSFTIPSGGTQDVRTSAAVLDQSGILKRTLWGNVSYPPGTYSYTWDGALDVAATSTPGQRYTIKVLTNSVVYKYDGNIGNTDAEWYLPNKYASNCGWYSGIGKITFAGNRGWVACHYNEATNPDVMVFDENTPTSPSFVNPQYKSYPIRQVDDIATDNQWVYLLYHGQSSNSGLTTPVDANSGMPVYFSQGTTSTILGVLGGSYIDPVAGPNPTDPSTGIAVQRTGNILAIAHGVTNTIKLFDKRSGVLLNTVTTPNRANQLAFTSEGLWYGNGANLYLITGLPSSPSVTQPIAGPPFQNIVAVGSNTLLDNLFVADGGTNQQIYEYAVTTHSLTRTIGKAGGYHDCNPTITHDRLLLDDTPTVGTNTGTYFHYVFVQAEDNDHVWVEDMAGQRIQHYDDQSRYVNQIIFRRPSYKVTLSETMPQRMFISWLEYSINYDVPLLPGDPDPNLGGNGSWALVKNWAVCAQGAHGSTSISGNQDRYYFNSVERLSNGRVYASAVAHPGLASNFIFELPDDGTPARNTGVVGAGGTIILRNGDQSGDTVTGSAPAKTVYSYHYPLTGFTGSNNPIYGSLVQDVVITTDASNSSLTPNAGASGTFQSERSTGGYYPIFNTAALNIFRYPHVGGIKTGYSSYAWTAMPEVPMQVPDYKGNYPQNASGNQGMGGARTEGTNFIFCLAGNYLPYGSQFYHYYEDGLLIGQFGNNQSFPKGNLYPYHPGNFGNATGWSTTTYNGNIYVYVGDESYATAHRWSISNLNSLHEYTGTTVLQPNASVTLTKVF